MKATNQLACLQAAPLSQQCLNDTSVASREMAASFVLEFTEIITDLMTMQCMCKQFWSRISKSFKNCPQLAETANLAVMTIPIRQWLVIANILNAAAVVIHGE